jgi:NNP family nitrate/nitrite transporter-like MFS transporter
MTTLNLTDSKALPASLEASPATRTRILVVSTAAFTLLFAVWLMFGILAIPIRKELNLSDMQFSWLTAIAILNGALWRLAFGILAERLGGRVVMTVLLLVCAVPVACVAFAHSFGALLTCAFLLGLAGNGFSAGIAWNSAWFPRQSQGFALGVFGAGNVGASVTKLIGPAVIAGVPAAGFSMLGIQFPGGWRAIPLIYAVLMIVMAAALFFLTPSRDRMPAKGRPLSEMLRPLTSVRVWRFSLYYVVVFGAYVALSVWLPKYYTDVYHASLPTAALLTALFIFPASLLRPFGGYLSDRLGARRVMYVVFAVMTLSAFFLALPSFTLVLDGSERTLHYQLNITVFTILVFMLGAGMGVGKAAVYKYIPEYFPKDVGAVGGLVGMLGALGGFFLPPLFAWTQSLTAIPQMTFLVLFLLIGISFAWLHVTVLSIVRKAAAPVRHQFELPAPPVSPSELSSIRVPV